MDDNHPARDIDKIDRRILRVLQEDGRISNLKLAEEVHLSPTAVLERVKRLSRDGYILGYEAKLNPTKLGQGLLVFVEILLDRTVHDVMTPSRPPCRCGQRSWRPTWWPAVSTTC